MQAKISVGDLVHLGEGGGDNSIPERVNLKDFQPSSRVGSVVPTYRRSNAIQVKPPTAP